MGKERLSTGPNNLQKLVDSFCLSDTHPFCLLLEDSAIFTVHSADKAEKKYITQSQSRYFSAM
jgi:hypothetical protein